MGGQTHGALRIGKWKLIVGTETQASWYGHFTPSSSWTGDKENIADCSIEQPCLHNMVDDKTEHINLVHSSSPEAKAALQYLLKRFKELESEYHAYPNPVLDE